MNTALIKLNFELVLKYVKSSLKLLCKTNKSVVSHNGVDKELFQVTITWQSRKYSNLNDAIINILLLHLK